MAHASKAAPKARRVEAFPFQNAMIGKIHVGKAQLQWDDETYYHVLFRTTGRSSSKDCTRDELDKMIKELTRLGAYNRPQLVRGKPKRPGSRAADHAAARKARALWISLSHLGAIEDSSEAALEAFATRQLSCARLQWADQSQMSSVIEALADIGRRHGWESKHKNLGVVKERLLVAILIKLQEKGFAAEDWTVPEAADRIAGFVHPMRAPVHWWDLGDLDAVAGKFGRLLKTGRKDSV
jgi:phage gp16-like protein